MGDRIRAFDWHSTSLGPIDRWPQTLVTILNMMLQSPVPYVLLWGADGIMLYNDPYAVFAGQRHPFLLGSKVVEGWPEVADWNRNVMKKGLAGETLSYKGQRLTLYRNNVAEEVWMDLNYSPVLDESGKPAGVLAVVFETTRQVEAEQDLKESEGRFKTLVKAVKDYAIYVADPSGYIKDWDEGAERVFGYRREEILGKPISLLFPSDENRQGTIRNELDTAVREGRYEAQDWRVRKGGQAFWANIIVSPLYSESGELLGFAKVIRDLTEHMKAETELKNSLKREQLTRRVAELSNQGLALDKILEILARDLGEFFQADRTFIIHLQSAEGSYRMGTYAQYCATPAIKPYDSTGMSEKLSEIYSRNLTQKSLRDIVRVSSPEEYIVYCQELLSEQNLSEAETQTMLAEMIALNLEREGMRAILRLPVSYRGKPYGNIVMHQCRSERVWTDAEVEILQEVATQIGNVLYQAEIAQAENAAKEALQKSFEQERLIRKIMEVIGQSFDIDLILNTIAHDLGTYLKADRCNISRFYFRDEKLIYCASGQYCAPGVKPIDREDIELITQALQDLTPKDIRPDQELVTNIPDQKAYIAHLRKEMAHYNLPGLPIEKLIEMVLKYGTQSNLRVNIRYRGVLYGSITLSQVSHNREWTAEEIELVKTIAGHAGGAIYQLELYKQAQETASNEQKARLESEDYAKRLEISNRELEQFATIASHDLREPLRKIQVFSEILHDKVVDDEGQDYLKRMNSAAARMQMLMDDLLTLSRINRKGQPFKRIQLDRIVSVVLEDLEIAIQETDATINVEPLATVYGDESQIRQLLQNLIGNAMKYHREGVPPVIRIFGRGKGNHFEVFVEDNGIGIDKAYFNQVFAPFARLHGIGKYAGTGIGLAICKKIVERHGGTIRVESQLNAGSKFIFTLPARD